MAFTLPKISRFERIIALVSIAMIAAVASLPVKTKPLGDLTFHAEAKNLTLFLRGDVPYSEVTVTKAPGPVLFYTPAYLLAPSDATDDRLWLNGVIFTSIMTAFAMLLMYRAASLLFSRTIGMFSVLLAFIFPIHCYYSLGILAEAPAFFSTALALYGWSLAKKKPERFNGWLWLIIGIWFLIMNRPNALLFPLLGLGIFLLAWFRNKNFVLRYGKKSVLSMCAILVLGFLSLQGAKAVSEGKTNQDQSGYFYYVAHQGRYEFREEPFDFRYWDDKIRPDSKDYNNWVAQRSEFSALANKDVKVENTLYREFLIADLAEHPFWFARSFAMKCIYGNLYFVNSMQPDKFHLGPFIGPIGYWLLMGFINLVNVVIIFGAIYFLCTAKGLLDYWPLWCVILALLIFHGITYMEPRYIFPSRVALYIMSAAGLYRFGFVRKPVDKLASLIFKAA